MTSRKNDKETAPRDQDAKESKTIASVHIEWNDRMEERVRAPSLDMGIANTAVNKTRCQRCWGRAVGRRNSVGGCTGIKCQVCGKRLEGAAAAKEEKRISKESMLNFMNMHLEHLPKYRDGDFVQKVFLGMPRLNKEEAMDRVERSKAIAKSKERRLTREGFPLGSAGLLFVQANLLVKSTETWFAEESKSAVGYSGVRVKGVKEDGSAIVSVPIDAKGISEDPGHQDHQLLHRLGSSMATALVLAFACELVLKAISLTSKDEAIRDHDLLGLYDDLPESSRNRIEADWGEIRRELDRARHTFGKWRYIEKNVGEKGVQSMINTQVARSLGRAARVLLDEAQFSGLDGGVSIEGDDKIHACDGINWHEEKVKMDVKGRETPLK